MHRLGGRGKPPQPAAAAAASLGRGREGEGETEDELDDDASVRSSHGSRAPLSDGDFDASEMDRYFRARDDLIPRYPNLHPSHVRRRVPYAP